MTIFIRIIQGECEFVVKAKHLSNGSIGEDSFYSYISLHQLK